MSKVEHSHNVRFILGEDVKSPEWDGVEAVRYLGDPSAEQVRWGGNEDPIGVLTPGEIYPLERVVIHSWHTKIFLEGIDSGRGFNSVSFEAIR